MTTLILTSYFFALGERFEGYRFRNLVGGILIAAIILSAAAYLIALFLSFSYGFQIQKQAAAEEKLARTFQEAELGLQRKMNLLAEGQISWLESMERVSSIRYLRPENVAVSQSPLRP